MRTATFAALLLACLTAGCGVPPLITPYRIDIQQGNNVSAEAVEQLKVGQTKEQVRQLLGTPLLNDVFHAERWDYMYYRVPSRGKREERKLVLFFEDGKLARFSGEGAPRKPEAK